MILDTFLVFLGISAVAGKCISERLYHNKNELSSPTQKTSILIPESC